MDARFASARAARRRSLLIDLLCCTLAAGASVLAAAWVLDLGNAQRHVPLTGTGDSMYMLGLVKGILDHGWYAHNPSLGFPFGQNNLYVAGFDGDTLQMVLLRLGGFVFSDAAGLLNAYFVGGFALVTASAFAVMRLLGVSRPPAAVAAILFSLLPFHFGRGLGHLFLGAYFAVPAGCWLVIAVLRDQPLLSDTGREGWRRVLGWQTAVTVVCVVLAGMSTLYYAVFTLLLVGVALVFRVVAAGSIRAARRGVMVFATVAAALCVNLAPAVINAAQNPRPAGLSQRLPVESERYSLTLFQLVTPVNEHRVKALRDFTSKYKAATENLGEGTSWMGTAGTVGLFGLLLLLGATLIRGRPEAEPTVAVAAGVGALSALLIGTFGGISEIIAYVVSPQVRAWNRISPFIAFFALLGVALGLDVLRRRAEGRRLTQTLFGIGLTGVLVLGILDQTTERYRQDYDANRKTWTNDGRFVAALERSLPPRSAVFQLPLHPFPEAEGQEKMVDYDPLRGYVHSNELRWSYGAIKGTAADWSSQAAGTPLEALLRQAAAAGFAAVYLDKFAYPNDAAEFEPQIQAITGQSVPLALSDDRRFVAFDLRPLATRLYRGRPALRARTRDALVRPVELKLGAGIFPLEGTGTGTWNWMGNRGELTLVNPHEKPRTVKLQATLVAPKGGTFRITSGGRILARGKVTSRGRPLELVLSVPARAKRTLEIETDAGRVNGDPRDLHLQLVGLGVV